MGKTVDINIPNIDKAEDELKKEIDKLNDLISQIKRLPFGSKCPGSTGKCAEVMSRITTEQMIKMSINLKTLMEQTLILLDDAKKKYQFMDYSVAEELKKK